MNKALLPLNAFFLTGQRSDGDFDDVRRMGFRPALFGAYRDLSKLRHDYPLVLIDGPTGGDFVRSLSDVIDALMVEKAPSGIDGERCRKNLLRLETEIRSLSASGAEGTLLQTWERARSRLVSGLEDAEREASTANLDGALRALPLDGEMVDCDARLPRKVLVHAWQAVHEDRSRQTGEEISDLVVKLTNILKTGDLGSGAAHRPERLRRSIGAAFEQSFDFDALSGLLSEQPAHDPLPETRRRRIGSVVETLGAQRFFIPAGAETTKRRRQLHPFVFDGCGRALKAFRERLPEMAELIKAMAIARLEIDNRYHEPTHDPFFENFDEQSLSVGDLALFPPCLAILESDAGSSERAKLLEIITSGLPIKTLVNIGDLLEDLPIEAGRLAFGAKGQELAGMALGLDDVYVLQSSSAYLYRMRDAVVSGLSYKGPALFSVFTGVSGQAEQAETDPSAGAPYLRTAAAVESRAFPVFVRDPAAGADWSSRFSLHDNPKAAADWPVHGLDYEDPELQRRSVGVAFTFADFVAGDGRFADMLAGLPDGDEPEGMVPLGDFLDLAAEDTEDKVPYVLMVDGDDVLHRAVVEDWLVEAARRCREHWHSLQELGGINNSHALKLLAEEKAAWERERETAPAPAAAPETPAAAVETAAAEAALPETAPQPESRPESEPEPEPVPSGEAYIETTRCTTCNECTEINNKMFVYNEDQQAVIADLDAGTYRQLVEAAESCQVAIIHPGSPRDPNEPGLDELIARAAPFL